MDLTALLYETNFVVSKQHYRPPNDINTVHSINEYLEEAYLKKIQNIYGYIYQSNVHVYVDMNEIAYDRELLLPEMAHCLNRSVKTLDFQDVLNWVNSHFNTGFKPYDCTYKNINFFYENQRRMVLRYFLWSLFKNNQFPPVFGKVWNKYTLLDFFGHFEPLLNHEVK